MADPEKPFKVNGGSMPSGIARRSDGRFVREDAVPPNPIEQEEDGRQPQQWAPKIGQNSDDMAGERKPWPKVGQAEATPSGKPMSVS